MAGSRETETNKQEGEPEEQKISLNNKQEGEEVKGSLNSSPKEQRLMRSVLENDKENIKDSIILSEGVAQGVQTFTPDMFFETMVKRYQEAKKLYGERLIKAISGYEPGYIERNIRVPEFKKELKNNIEQKIKSLTEKGFLNKEGNMNEEGLTIASLILVKEELEKLKTKGILGEKETSKGSKTGEKQDKRKYQKQDPYKSISFKSTIKKTIRRGRQEIRPEDLTVIEKEDKQRTNIIYAIDTSGSMKGKKLAAAKRAGLALAYKAINHKDEVGIITFGKTITNNTNLTKNFTEIVKTIATSRATNQTNLALAIKEANKTFNNKPNQQKKHLILLTDCLHTIGTEEEVLKATSEAKNNNITISVIGLGLNEEGAELGKKITEISKGTIRLVKNYEDLDLIILEEYQQTRKK